MASVSWASPLASQSVVYPAVSIVCASSGSRSAHLCQDELNTSIVGCSHGRPPVCLLGPVLRTRTGTLVHSDHLASSYKGGQSAKPSTSTVLQNGIFINAARTNTDESALIEVEDETDGSILFKYGGLEDIWELDRMMEFLCRGAFNTYNVESLVPIIVELLRVPISTAGQRRIVELLLSSIRTNRDVELSEAEKMVSQILAEATSEFLPPASTGLFKGRIRPTKRFSSRLDKWWQEVDSFLGVGEDDLEYWGDDEFRTFGRRSFQAEPLSMNEGLSSWNDHGYKALKPAVAQPVKNVHTLLTCEDSPASVNWMSCSADSLMLEAPRTLEFVTDQYTAYESVDGRNRQGAGFVLLSSQFNTLDDVLKRSDQVLRTWQPDVRRKPTPSFSETLSISSIQEMIEWEQEEVVVTPVSVPNKKGHFKKTTQTSQQRTRSRSSHQRFQSKVGSSRSTKKRSNAQRIKENKLFDIFFTLPLTHTNSGVASFLDMRKGLSHEISTVLNQGSVVLAGGGLAVVLHVAARMLSINSTFDRYKLFGLIRGAALIWLSAAMQKLRCVLLLLPPECTISNCRNKKQLVALQHQLRTLSLKAFAVIVLSVVGTGM